MSISVWEECLAQQIKVLGLPAPEREVLFHSVRKWRFDFAWPALKVACEVEGGAWTRGRHTRGAGFQEDCRKYSTAAVEGWCVIRATSGMVETGEAVRLLEAVLGRGLR